MATKTKTWAAELSLPFLPRLIHSLPTVPTLLLPEDQTNAFESSGEIFLLANFDSENDDESVEPATSRILRKPAADIISQEIVVLEGPKKSTVPAADLPSRRRKKNQGPAVIDRPEEPLLSGTEDSRIITIPADSKMLPEPILVFPTYIFPVTFPSSKNGLLNAVESHMSQFSQEYSGSLNSIWLELVFIKNWMIGNRIQLAIQFVEEQDWTNFWSSVWIGYNQLAKTYRATIEGLRRPSQRKNFLLKIFLTAFGHEFGGYTHLFESVFRADPLAIEYCVMLFSHEIRAIADRSKPCLSDRIFDKAIEAISKRFRKGTLKSADSREITALMRRYAYWRRADVFREYYAGLTPKQVTLKAAEGIVQIIIQEMIQTDEYYNWMGCEYSYFEYFLRLLRYQEMQSTEKGISPSINPEQLEVFINFLDTQPKALANVFFLRQRYTELTYSDLIDAHNLGISNEVARQYCFRFNVRFERYVKQMTTIDLSEFDTIKTDLIEFANTSNQDFPAVEDILDSAGPLPEEVDRVYDDVDRGYDGSRDDDDAWVVALYTDHDD